LRNRDISLALVEQSFRGSNNGGLGIVAPFRWESYSVALWLSTELGGGDGVDVLAHSAHGFASKLVTQEERPCYHRNWCSLWFFSNVNVTKLVRLSFFLVGWASPLHRSVLGVGRIGCFLFGCCHGRPCSGCALRAVKQVQTVSLPGLLACAFFQSKPESLWYSVSFSSELSRCGAARRPVN